MPSNADLERMNEQMAQIFPPVSRGEQEKPVDKNVPDIAQAQRIKFDDETGLPICEDCGRTTNQVGNCPNCIHNPYRKDDPFDPSPWSRITEEKK